jgi:lambda family phage portal protein
MKLAARLRHLTTALTGRAPTGRLAARYAGGEHSRIVARWFATLDDPNEELRGTLTDLRARSRQLCRDNGEAAGLLLDFEADIVGASGARLQYRARRPRGAFIESLNDRVEAAFATWSAREFCTVAGYESFPALQRLMMRSVIMDGEFLALRVRDPDLPYGYRLQPIDADQLDDMANRRASATHNAIVMGVEIDADGRPVAYHFWDRHPSLAGRVKRVEPAANVLHVFKRVRIGQVRGVPWFAPALITWKLGDRYTEAELYQSLLAAAQGGFFVNRDGSAGIEIPRDAEGRPIPLTMEAEPGAARVLPSGYEFQEWKPTHPTANYVGFMKAVKRGIARAFGRSYASLTGDLSEVNFSSMRTDRVREMTQSRMHQQDLLVEQFCRPIFADWVRINALLGTFGPVTLSSEQLAQAATWMLTGWPWIDPVKDATAAVMEVNAGFNSPQRICAERGRDFFEIVDEIAEAKAYAEAAGVSFETIPLTLAVTVNPNDNPDAPTDTASTTTGRSVLPLRREVA